MNTRFSKESITDINWPKKKQTLYHMLHVLNETESVYLKSGKNKGDVCVNDDPKGMEDFNPEYD